MQKLSLDVSSICKGGVNVRRSGIPHLRTNRERESTAVGDGPLRLSAYCPYSRMHFSNRGGGAFAMRGIIVLGIGFVIAFWVDHHYYNGMYSRETGDIIDHIAASFKH